MPIDFTNPQDKVRHDRLVSLVEKMLALHQQLLSAKTAADRELIQRQIDATDRSIDGLVYELPQGVDGGRDQDCGRKITPT